MIWQREEIRALLALQTGDLVLDIGCGPGILAGEMADEVGLPGGIWGIDISETMLGLAEKRRAAKNTIALQLGRAEELPFADHTFDAAVAVQVYEYVTDIDRALEELFRVLKPGGRAVILDTDWDSLVWNVGDRSRIRKILDLWDEHLADPRLPERLTYLLRETGFEEASLKILPFLNRDCHEGTYSYWLIGFIRSFLEGRSDIDSEEVRAWVEELQALDRENRYFFSLNRYIFKARKPI
jgi:ubiquinone/menaquinone biosynthesis C-methylase UbiE